MSAGSIQHHLAEAQRARQAGCADRARGHLEAVLAIDADQPAARNALGLEALERRDPRSAAEHFHIACSRDPGAPPLWMNLARAQRELGDPEAERAALERVLMIDQRDLLALIRLAELHERLGEEALAAQRWSAVISLSAGIGDRSAEFVQLIERAKSYVEGQSRKLAEAVDERLAGDLAEASARDSRRLQAAAGAMLGRRAMSVVVLGLLVTLAPRPAVADPLLDFTAIAKSAARKGSSTLGWSFSTSVDLLVDGFGLWDDSSDLLYSAHDVGLWTSDGTLVSSATVDNTATPVASASGAQWLFTSVTPFALAPGDYVLAAFYPVIKLTETTGSDGYTVAAVDSILTIAGVTYTGSAAITSSALTFPISGDALFVNGVFGPNLSVRSVPEPASILLLATGLIAAGIARRRSARR